MKRKTSGGRVLKKILAVIPTYNERENIDNILRRVLDVDDRIHVLVVDDASPDGTGEIVREESEANERIHLLCRNGKQGLGTAYVAGFQYAISKTYDAVVQIDADFSHSPEDIPRLIRKAEQGADFVIGSRYIKGVNVVNWPLQRLLISYFASVYARMITGMPFRDTTAGFSLIRRCVLETIPLDEIQTNGYGFQIEIKFLAWKQKFRVVEIPIVFTEREEGHSKMNRKIMLEAIFLVWKLRFGPKCRLNQ